MWSFWSIVIALPILYVWTPRLESCLRSSMPLSLPWNRLVRVTIRRVSKLWSYLILTSLKLVICSGCSCLPDVWHLVDVHIGSRAYLETTLDGSKGTIYILPILRDHLSCVSVSDGKQWWYCKTDIMIHDILVDSLWVFRRTRNLQYPWVSIPCSVSGNC